MVGDDLAARRKAKPGSRQKVDYTFLLLASLMGISVFLLTVWGIRYWQKMDPLEPYLRGHPRWDTSSLEDNEKIGETSTYRVPKFNLQEDADRILLEGRLASPLRRRRHRRRDVELISAPYPISQRDLVFAIPTHNATKAQLKAGRSARMGMRTVVITDYAESVSDPYPAFPGETWTSYPDAVPVRSFYPGDQRAALAPFLAFKELGNSFKWLLYGDDDTVFFPDAAMKLASSMDPDMPYFVTDNLWWSPPFGQTKHPHLQAPRCLPCGYTRNVTDAMGMKMAAGCPCKPSVMCELPGGYADAFSNGCGPPRIPVRTYSLHGGAGALVSIGLLRAIDYTTMSRCVNEQWSSGGDAFLTFCLWQHGYGHTTPDPMWHPTGLQMFDPSPPPLNPDDSILQKASHILGNMLQEAAGVCEGLCKLEMEKTVTLHLRARRTGGSVEGAALFVRAFSRMYTRLSGTETSRPVQANDDCSNPEMTALATTIDDILAVAVQAIGRLTLNKQEKGLSTQASEHHNNLIIETPFGKARVGDAVQSGIVDSIALRFLEKIQEIALQLGSDKR